MKTNREPCGPRPVRPSAAGFTCRHPISREQTDPEDRIGRRSDVGGKSPRSSARLSRVGRKIGTGGSSRDRKRHGYYPLIAELIAARICRSVLFVEKEKNIIVVPVRRFTEGRSYSLDKLPTSPRSYRTITKITARAFLIAPLTFQNVAP